MKKFDHMTITDETGKTITSESGSVKLENPLGMEREGIATSSGPHKSSYKRVVPRIVGNIVFSNGQKLKNMDFTNRRITLRDTVSGARLLCHNCETEKMGALGKENAELGILVLGEIQEL